MEKHAKSCDFLLFHEVWTTGFCWDNLVGRCKEAERALGAIADMARENQLWIVSTTLTKGKQNMMHLISPEGEVVCQYAKIHLFGMMQEDLHIKKGNELGIYEHAIGKIGLSICYDFRFPELYRSLALQGCQMIFHAAVFPMVRLDHWKVLTRARAIENQVFMVSSNCVGKGKWDYCGHSAVIDPFGEVLAEGGTEEELITAEVDMGAYEKARSRFNPLADRRSVCYQL